MTLADDLRTAKALALNGIGPADAIDRVTPAKSRARTLAYAAMQNAKPYDWVAADWSNDQRVALRFDRAIAAAESDK